MTFDVIVCDWPWYFQAWAPSGEGRSPKYPKLKLHDLSTFDQLLKPVMHSGSILFFWVTWPFLLRAGRIVEDIWGLPYATCGFNWVKFYKNQPDVPFMGQGFYTRGNSEPCLIFVNETIPKRADKSVRQVIVDWEEWETESIGTPVAKHSEKPDAVQERIEQLYPGASYLELFARRKRPGWVCLGDEIDGQDIRDSLPALAAAKRV